MVEQIVADLGNLRDDIWDQALHHGKLDIDKARDWATVIDYICERLQLPRCPECGEGMQFDPTLQSDACQRHEE